MSVDPALRAEMMQKAQGAAELNLAFVGVARGLFDALAEGALSVEALAAKAGADPGYVLRWCEAAYAFELLDAEGEAFSLSARGQAFCRAEPGSLFPFAAHVALGGHMSERAATLMQSGERPGERVLAERESLLPLFGPMLEASFGPLFEAEILPQLPVFAELDARGGVAVDLGCGNGWYLRRLAARFPGLRGVGLDGFEENIRQATELSEAQGLGGRLSFQSGDIFDFSVDGPVDLIAMNRALHHVWSDAPRVFEALRDHLRPGGVAVIWEPRWPDSRAGLRHPRWRGMAIQNLSEHVQGNHFLRPDEIEAAFAAVGMTATRSLFAEGAEQVIVGTRPVEA